MTAAAPAPAPAPARDLATMTRRSLTRMRRYPSLTVMLVAMPVVLLLLFVYVFGGAIGAGVGTGAAPGAAGRAAYLDYITPAILVLTASAVAQATSINVAMDMTGGVVTRLRTMPVAPVAVLGGHVVGAVVQTLLAGAVVLTAAVLLGYRPGAGAAGGLALLGFYTLLAITLTWLTVAMGVTARSVESASNTPMVLLLLPFLSSGFVPVETMPVALRWFTEHQPFTPVNETVRVLLAGSPVDLATLLAALAWSIGLAILGWALARRAYRRPRPVG